MPLPVFGQADPDFARARDRIGIAPVPERCDRVEGAQVRRIDRPLVEQVRAVKLDVPVIDRIADAAVAIRYELFFRPSHLQCMDW